MRVEEVHEIVENLIRSRFDEVVVVLTVALRDSFQLNLSACRAIPEDLPMRRLFRTKQRNSFDG